MAKTKDEVKIYKFLLVLAGLVLAIMVLISITKLRLLPQTTPFDLSHFSVITLTPTLQANIDTSNWQKFTNTRYGFSFLYPDGWSVQSFGLTGKDLTNSNYLETNGTFSFDTSLKAGFTVQVNAGGNGFNDKNCKTLDECISKRFPKLPAGAQVIDEIYKNSKAKRLYFVDENSGNSSKFVYLFVIIDNNLYSFSTQSDPQTFPVIERAFNSFLDSFKFTK